MMDLHLSELDVRMLEHHRRVNVANRRGWSPANLSPTGQRTSRVTILGAIGTRLAASMMARENTGIAIRLDAPATGESALSMG